MATGGTRRSSGTGLTVRPKRRAMREGSVAGKPVYDPGAIRVPVLLSHAEWDADVSIGRTPAFFLRLTGAPYRRWAEAGEGTHLVILENNRVQILGAILRFIEEDYSPDL
jgi:alpha-beta hydrolase superfamily lysophospholipase